MNSEPDPGRHDHFVTTRWTMVLSAGRKSSPHADQALSELCQTYWFPLYAYIRRRGYSKEDAEDLAQAFFAKFLEKNYLEGLKAERGKFRAFLLASLKHFLSNEWDKSQAQKRGGGTLHLSIQCQTAEDRYIIEPASDDSPDKLFDREWALSLLDHVITRLRHEFIAEGKEREFNHLRGYLMLGEKTIPYAEAAKLLAIDETAARVAVHRLRKRYRQLLRDEIAQTLSDPTRVEDELRSLQSALTS